MSNYKNLDLFQLMLLFRALTEYNTAIDTTLKATENMVIADEDRAIIGEKVKTEKNAIKEELAEINEAITDKTTTKLNICI